jgi:predicted deacylase
MNDSEAGGVRRTKANSDIDLEIPGMKLERGCRCKTKLSVLEFADGAMLEIPVMVLRGAKPGPVFYLGSAFHGDEVNGVAVVSKLAHEIDLAELSGTMIVVPAQNPPALQVQNRYSIGHFAKSPLDQGPADPWVCFPGHCDGNMASLIANKLYTELMQHADYMVDIHTPTTGGRYAPFAFLPPGSAGSTVAESEALAKAFGADFVLASDQGVYVQDASPHVVMAKRGAVALGLEIGEGGQLDPEVTERGLRGMRNMLGAVGMLKREKDDFGGKLVITSQTVVRAHRGGILNRRVELNEQVKKGQTVAVITNLFGEVVEEIPAPHEGPIVRIATFPTVGGGERVVQIGVPR